MKHLNAQGAAWCLTLVSVCREGSVKERWWRDERVFSSRRMWREWWAAGRSGGDAAEVNAWVSLALCAVHIDTIKPPQSLELKTQLLTCYVCHFCGKRNCKNILIFTFSQNSLWCRWLWRRCFEVAKVCWVMFILLSTISNICVWLSHSH